MRNTIIYALLLITLLLIIGCTQTEKDTTRPINRTLRFNLTDIPNNFSVFFYSNCSSKALSKIKININSHQIWNGLPDCNITMNFFHNHFPRYLKIGENNINFYAEKGYYDIKDIKISSQP